jgi:hypothetical protein
MNQSTQRIIRNKIGLLNLAEELKVYSELDDLQADLDAWVDSYNNERSHQGKMCCGRTPMQTLREGRELWEAKVSSMN